MKPIVRYQPRILFTPEMPEVSPWLVGVEGEGENTTFQTEKEAWEWGRDWCILNDTDYIGLVVAKITVEYLTEETNEQEPQALSGGETMAGG